MCVTVYPHKPVPIINGSDIRVELIIVSATQKRCVPFLDEDGAAKEQWCAMSGLGPLPFRVFGDSCGPELRQQALH